MAKIFEFYRSIEISKQDERIRFPKENAHNDKHDYLDEKIKITMLEIKSSEPPTDCMLHIVYLEDGSNVVHSMNIHLMKYRQKFIFENGIYILYFTEVEEFKENMNPETISFINKRDTSCVLRFFYRISFPELPRNIRQ